MIGTLKQPELISASGGTCDSGSSTGHRTNSTFTPSSARGKSFDTSISSTPSKMKTADNTSAGLGQFIDSPSQTHRYHIPHQQTTFPQLAQEQGIRSWNPDVLDDRWHLTPRETQSSSTSMLTSSPERLNTMTNASPFPSSQGSMHWLSGGSIWNDTKPQQSNIYINQQQSSSSDTSDEGGVRLDKEEQPKPEIARPTTGRSQRCVPLVPFPC